MMRHWRKRCLICGKRFEDLVEIQEHVVFEHDYRFGDLRNVTRREIENGFIYTMPDGRDWMEATRAIR
jgi:hypothetical protein